MARTDSLTNFLTDVSTAIKTKKGDSTPIPASNFDTEITNLPSGGDENAIIDVGSYQGGGEYLYQYISEVPPINASTLKYSNNLSYMYYQIKKIKEVSITNTGNATNMNSMFSGCSSLETFPNMNTSNVERFDSICNGCSKLKNFPVIDMSSATYVYNMFFSCSSLTDQSLDNILQSLITATSYTGTKTLAYIGFTRYSIVSSRWQSQPHYQDFIEAGWTIGY